MKKQIDNFVFEFIEDGTILEVRPLSGVTKVRFSAETEVFKLLSMMFDNKAYEPYLRCFALTLFMQVNMIPDFEYMEKALALYNEWVERVNPKTERNDERDLETVKEAVQLGESIDQYIEKGENV